MKAQMVPKSTRKLKPEHPGQIGAVLVVSRRSQSSKLLFSNEPMTKVTVT
jgi:hypothetical protein